MYGNQTKTRQTSDRRELVKSPLAAVVRKIQDSSLTTTHSAHNVGFIFDEHLTFSDQISALSTSC